MSAEPRTLKTEAEQALAAAYRSAGSTLPGTAAALKRRDDAFAQFERQGLPHRRVEAWKYTDLRALMRKAQPLAAPPIATAAAEAAARDPLADVDRYRLVIADGRFQPELSDRAGLLDQGVEVATLAEFLAFDDPRALEVLDPPAGGADDAMVALNAALASDGVVILVREGKTLTRPIEIAHLSTGSTPAAWFARSFVRVGKNAGVKLLLTYSGPDGVAHQTNTVTGISVAENAKVSVTDLQRAGDATQHIATFHARIGARATFDHLSIAAGSALSRLQGFVTIEGEGARIVANGVNLLRGKTHGDVALVLDHAAEGATSRVLYRNVADGNAEGAFQGRIIVRPGAQKTDGRMMTNTLMLSDTAEFAAKPELEIYADDVQCGHGATTGRIDEGMMFYLRARGIPAKEAEAMLLKAFLVEAVEQLGDPALTEALEPTIAGWLARRAP